jgi:hypothetical protein
MIRTTAVLWRSWSRSGQLTLFLLLSFSGPAAFGGGTALSAHLSTHLTPYDKSRAGGTRTPDLRFWRPLLYQLSYCPPLKTLTGSPGGWCASYPTGNTSLTGCGPGCCAGSCACGSSGACTPRKPALLIVAQSSSESQERGIAPLPSLKLLQDLGDDTGTHSSATFSDGEIQPLIHGYGRDELYLHDRVVSWHDHLHTFL